MFLNSSVPYNRRLTPGIRRERRSMQLKIKHLATALYVMAMLCIPPALAAEESKTELAKKTQNPVADLISVPFQNNFNFGAGTNHDQTIYNLNVQPVIPLHLTEDWNLITRIIAPINNQPSLFPGAESAFGLGDLNPTFFLSPAKSG